MRAVVMRAFGAADVLAVEDVQAPDPGPGEALVRVGAVAVSRTRDVATRSGRHPFSKQVKELPHVLGGDFAGVVERVGPGVDEGLAGRRVVASCSATCGECAACRSGREPECPDLEMLGIHRWGSYAELVAVPMQSVHELPEDMGMAEAAALGSTGPIAGAQLALAGLAPGAWVLITGATGALGSTLTALATEQGARAIALSRRPEAVAGSPAATLDAAEEDLAGVLMELTGGAGVAAAIDNVCSADVFARYLPALAIGGRVVISGTIGMEVLPVPAGPFYLRGQSLLGLRTATPRDHEAFWAQVRAGFRLPADALRTLPIEAAAEAHAGIESGAAAGHAVLEIAP
jgi:NADPH:quinone reductase-like Zn-dependent oxidoreductase